MRGGEAARRGFDVFLERPAVHRNEVWETEHVQVKVEVDVDGERRRPWVTWFIDCATRVICGFAVTAQVPSRESVLVALRDAISREGEHGPFGGVPGAVRVDRGKDFLSRTVGEALGAFAVPVVDLPGSSARPRRGPLPPPRADHYLSLPDAHVMGTAAMNQTLANLGG